MLLNIAIKDFPIATLYHIVGVEEKPKLYQNRDDWYDNKDEDENEAEVIALESRTWGWSSW